MAGLLAVLVGALLVVDGGAMSTQKKSASPCGQLATYYPAIFGDDAVNTGSYFAGMKLVKCLAAGWDAELWSASMEADSPGGSEPVALKVSIMAPQNSTRADNSDMFEDECTFAKLAKDHVKEVQPQAVTDCLDRGAVNVVPTIWSGAQYRSHNETSLISRNDTVSLAYMVYEFSTGTDLQTLLKQSPETPSNPLMSLQGVFAFLDDLGGIMKLFADPLSGVPVDHLQLYHADMVPSNVMVSNETGITVVDFGNGFMCCDETVPVRPSGDGKTMICDLKQDIGFETFATPQNDSSTNRMRPRPCQGRWADNTTEEQQLYKQKENFAQNFIYMILEVPEDVQDGLYWWWTDQQQRQEEEPQNVFPVKESLRPAYRDQWTEECDIAVQKALLPAELCGLPCFQQALDAASRSLQRASFADVEHAHEKKMQFWVTPWWHI